MQAWKMVERKREREWVRVRVSMEPFVEQHLVYRTCTLNANTTTHTANLIFSASHEGAKFYFQFELMLDLGRQRWARASVCREHVYRKFNLQIDLLRFWILLHKVLVIVSWTASVDSMPILFSFFPRMSSRSKNPIRTGYLRRLPYLLNISLGWLDTWLESLRWTPESTHRKHI